MAGAADQLQRQVAAVSAGLGDGGEVVGGHDLAHAGAEGLGQHRHVEPPTEQDDADLGSVDTCDLGEVAGLLEVHVRPDDDQPLGVVRREDT